MFKHAFLTAIVTGAVVMSTNANAALCNPAATSVSLPLPANFQGWCNPGQGIMTGAWASAYNGQARLRWGDPGKLFSVDFKNTQSTSRTDQQEFDFSMKRDIWQGERQGYGTVRLQDALLRNLTLTQTARWEKAPRGKTHVNVIIWLNRKFRSESKANDAAIDVTISEWFHAGKENFRNGKLPQGWKAMGRLNHAESAYDVYKRKGDLQEKASYLVIRHRNRTTGSVNAGVFLKWLLSKESRGDRTFNGDWYISSMGWEITGQSAGFDKAIGNGSGKYTFSCYSIPSLTSDRAGPGFATCAGDGPINPGRSGFVFSRTDKTEFRWITKDSTGQNGSIWISQACARSLGGATQRGDWFKLMEVAPRFDTVANPCR
ncbi:MAG: hypothetical protein AB8C46_24005 [Burkholderiaceae bacterium]